MTFYSSKNTVLLITTCVFPSISSIGLSDPHKRLLYTLEGIERWKSLLPDFKIVICDGSNYDFNPHISLLFPGCEIECLHFQNSSDMTRMNGVGYGEGEIIKYALDNSKYLHISEYIIKSTGKLWVSNIKNCLSESNPNFIANAFFSNVFSFRNVNIQYIDTRFYIFNKNFYINNLLDVYKETSYAINKSIENVFLKVILDLNIKGFIFFNNPIINGVSGSAGTYYKNNLRRNLKNLLKKTMLRRNIKFKNLIYCEHEHDK